MINATVATLAVGRWLRNPAARNITLNAQEQATPHDAAFVPWVVCAVHLLFLASIVLTAHHPVLFIGLFLLFMGFVQAYKTHQSPLILKEALLVAFFLAEMGDKTQIATVMLAAQYNAYLWVVAGTTLGMMLADAPVVWLGDRITRLVPIRVVHGVSAVIFLVLGLVAIFAPV